MNKNIQNIIHSRINIGVTSVVYGFGDIRRGAKLWLFELIVALAFYPGLKLYAAIHKLLKTYSGT